MSTAAMIRAVQDRVLADGHGAATVSVYGGLVRTLDHLLGGEAEVDSFPDDPVLQAALTEVSPEARGPMVAWLLQHATLIVDASAVLDQLDELADPFPVTPAGAETHRRAAEELVHDAGHCCAAVAWAGTEAIFEFTRLYTSGGGGEGDLRGLLARDPVAAAAFRQLSDEELRGVRAWVRENWERIDDVATERAT